jgi:putative ABC transport system substrate-binding protein
MRLDLRWGGDDTNRMRAHGHELVGLKPDIVFTSGTPATAALQRETRTIPIVFTVGADPVASGIVARLDRPGGNAGTKHGNPKLAAARQTAIEGFRAAVPAP